MTVLAQRPEVGTLAYGRKKSGEAYRLDPEFWEEFHLIRYSHDRTEELDRPALEKRVCECYGLVRRVRPAAT